MSRRSGHQKLDPKPIETLMGFRKVLCVLDPIKIPLVKGIEVKGIKTDKHLFRHQTPKRKCRGVDVSG